VLLPVVDGLLDWHPYAATARFVNEKGKTQSCPFIVDPCSWAAGIGYGATPNVRILLYKRPPPEDSGLEKPVHWPALYATRSIQASEALLLPNDPTYIKSVKARSQVFERLANLASQGASGAQIESDPELKKLGVGRFLADYWHALFDLLRPQATAGSR
jgi:hypothetical protein